MSEPHHSRQQTPEGEAIVRTGGRLTIHQAMNADYILGTAVAVRKVTRFYAA